MKKIKIKPILPTLRERKRYLVYEVISNRKLAHESVKKEIKKSILDFIGELGYAKSGVIIMDDWKNNKGLIKINHNFVDQIKASLSLIKTIDDQKVIVKSSGLSGILNKSRKKFVDA